MSSQPNGNTLVFGVIGDPINHSLSPQIHAYFAQLCGINMSYLPFHVQGDNIEAALRGAFALGIRGLNVTVPHKKAVLPHVLQPLDDFATQVGTVNTLVWEENGYSAHNTDYIGIQRSLAAINESFTGRRVAVIGAGGSAYAACVAAAAGGAASICIINRSQANAHSLARHLKCYYNIPIDVFEHPMGQPEIIIQTTTLGFGEALNKSPVSDLSFFAKTQLAFDIIYTPWETVFMRQAKQSGVPQVINGFPMLVYQAMAAFNIWQKRFFPDAKGLSNNNDENHVKTLRMLLNLN